MHLPINNCTQVRAVIMYRAARLKGVGYLIGALKLGFCTTTKEANFIEVESRRRRWWKIKHANMMYGLRCELMCQWTQPKTLCHCTAAIHWRHRVTWRKGWKCTNMWATKGISRAQRHFSAYGQKYHYNRTMILVFFLTSWPFYSKTKNTSLRSTEATLPKQ